MARKPFGTQRVQRVFVLLSCLFLSVDGVMAGEQVPGVVLMASVPDESPTLLSRPAEMLSPLSLPEEPAVLTLPEDALTVPRLPESPALTLPLTDPLTVLPLPEKPADSAKESPRKRAISQGNRRPGGWGEWPQRRWFNQQVYWRYCAVCHGVLPADRLDALVMRNAQRWGGGGFSVGPWHGDKSQGNGRGGW